MKIRAGFVSNSSSSSFCIYGIAVSNQTEVVYKFLKSLTLEEYVNTWRNTDVQKEEYELIQKYETYGELEADENVSEEKVSSIEEKCNDMAHEILEYVGANEFMIGLRPWEIKDDETGAQFKERARQFIKDLTGVENPEPVWECEAFYD